MFRYTTLPLVLALAAATSSHAAVTVTELGSFDDDPTSQAVTLDPTDFDATSSNDILVLTYGGKQQIPSNVLYNGVAPTGSIDSPSTFNNVYIFYWLNPTAGTGTVTLNTSRSQNDRHVQLRALLLDNAAQQAPESSTTATQPDTSTSMSIGPISVSEGAFVVDSVGSNNSAFLNAGSSGLGNVLFNTDNDDRNASSYRIATAADATDGVTSTWTYTLGGGGKAGVIASFAAIPEPGSLALIGLGSLCILSRRRG